MAQYLILLHEGPSDFADFTPSEMQQIIEKYRAWSVRLQDKGQLLGSNKLKENSGRFLHQNGGRTVVTDGPFSETKEVIGGYFLIEADSYEDAVEIASDCPHLTYGSGIEIREVDLLH